MFLNLKIMTGELKSKVVIVDDDPRAVERLKEILSPYSDLEIVADANNAATALEAVTTHQPQLLFLDIDLPDGNGFDLINCLQQSENPPYIVMYTAFYDRYSTVGKPFSRGEHDYLLKPIDTLELDKTIQRFRYAKAPGRHEASIHTLGSSNNDSENKIVVALTKVTSEIRVLHISDIGYFFYNSKRKLWEAVTRDNTIVTLKKTTSATDILNYSSKLIQTHQSFIVNIDYVMLISKSKVNLFAPFQDAEILVGRIYFKNLQTRLMYL